MRTKRRKRLETADELKAAVGNWAAKIKARPKQIRVQRMTRKWASCSGREASHSIQNCSVNLTVFRNSLSCTNCSISKSRTMANFLKVCSRHICHDDKALLRQTRVRPTSNGKPVGEVVRFPLTPRASPPALGMTRFRFSQTFGLCYESEEKPVHSR